MTDDSNTEEWADIDHAGDEHLAAVWIKGREEVPKAKKIIVESFAADTANKGLVFTEISYETLLPGQADVPPPPEPGMALLVGSAIIKNIVDPEDPDGIKFVKQRGKSGVVVRSFFDDLEPKGQEQMIKVTQQEYAKLNPGKPPLSVERCVDYIEMVAPDVWEREIKTAVDAGRV